MVCVPDSGVCEVGKADLPPMIPTLGTLFSGGGCVEFGAEGLLTPVYAVEYDKTIAASYEVNHGRHCLNQKVQDVNWFIAPQVDVAWASPPCPNFSVANKDKGETAEDLAMAEGVCQMLRFTRPKAFVLENVEGYRHSCSFQNILSCLTEEGYRFRFSVVNSADFSVPQTRRRLILRAVHGKPVPDLIPTHAKFPQFGLFGNTLPWNGWHGAIEDLIPELPESQFAKWQIARLPNELLETTLLWDMKHTIREPDRLPMNEPALTVTAGLFRRPSHIPIAFLLRGENAGQDWGKGYRDGEEPATTLSANGHLKAFLVDGQQTVPGKDGARGITTRPVEEPAMSVCASSYKGAPKAFLLEGDAAGDRCPTLRQEDEPAFTVKTDGGGRVHRAWLEQGRVVSMTPRCLARFMGIPDHAVLPDKPSLACRIIGNGVCPPLARVIFESLLEVL